MKTFLFIGSNSDVAKEALKRLESNGNKVICISRNHIDEVENNLIGNPVINDLPEIEVEIDGLV